MGHTPSVTHPITSATTMPQQLREQPRFPQFSLSRSLGAARLSREGTASSSLWKGSVKPEPRRRKMTRAHLKPFDQGVNTSFWPSYFCRFGLTSEFSIPAPRPRCDAEGVSTTSLAAEDRSCSGSRATDRGSALSSG